MNRLDDVCGPGGWEDEYEVTDKGVVCKIQIAAPGTGERDFMHIARSGISGYPDMASIGGEEDDEAKGAGTTSFKLAACKLGIGRDLYNEGMPAYCADLFDGVASATPQQQRPPLNNAGGNGRSNGKSGSGGGGDWNCFNSIPFGKAGTKAPFAWAKQVGDYFQIDVVGRMSEYGKKKEKGFRTDSWDEQFLNECLRKTVDWLKTLDHYQGEFEDADAASDTAYSAAGKPPQSSDQKQRNAEYAGALEAVPTTYGGTMKPAKEAKPNWAEKTAALKAEEDAKRMAEFAAGTNQAKAAQKAEEWAEYGSPEMVSLKKAIASSVTALIYKKTGRAPSQGEVVAGIGEMGSSVPNGRGHRGEVLESLKLCTDKKWLNAILAESQKRIADIAKAEAASAPIEDDFDSLPS